MNKPAQNPTSTSTVSIRHPLDPLSAEKLTEATAVIRNHFQWGDDLRVETIDVGEPPKAVVRGFREGDAIRRIARFNVYRRGVMGVWRGKIDLSEKKVIAQEFRADAIDAASPTSFDR
jgi:primary-amine oxidase